MKEEHSLTRWPRNRRPPDQKELEQALVAEGYDPLRMVDPPCTYYHTESHSYGEVRWVVRGQLEIGLDDRQIVLQTGDRLYLPAGTPHWVKVLSEDGATYLLAAK